MSKCELKKGIYWVGAVDWDLRNFHGFATWEGITYNSYLVVDEKVALIDTVKAPFYDEMLNNIKKIIDPKKIDYIIANHGEYDHSSGLVRATKDFENAELICSTQGTISLEKMYQKNWKYTAVKEGDSISLGSKTLHFVPVPMLHWPDSMVTYLSEDKILFSNDAFGQHIASSKRFDDEIGVDKVVHEAGKYYANIVMPLANIVLKALEKLSKLSIEMIAPSHGIIWRTHVEDILKAYLRWANGESDNRVIVVYDTMWHATEKMARSIVDGIISVGVEAKLYNLTSTVRSDIAYDILESKALVVGSPTIHNAMFPTVAEFLYYFKCLKPKNKIGAAFGTYGWKKGISSLIENELKEASIDVIDENIEVQFVPDEEELQKCYEFGKKIAQRL